jgi:hypothetical protein
MPSLASLQASADARLEPALALRTSAEEALDSAFTMVVVRTVEANLKYGGNEAALGAAAKLACLPLGVDCARFRLCGGNERTEMLLGLLRDEGPLRDLGEREREELRARVHELKQPPKDIRGEVLTLWLALAAHARFSVALLEAWESEEVRAFEAERQAHAA